MHDFGRPCWFAACATTRRTGRPREWFRYGWTWLLLPTIRMSSVRVLTLPQQDPAPAGARRGRVQRRHAGALRRPLTVWRRPRRRSPIRWSGVRGALHRLRFAAIGDAAVGMHPVTRTASTSACIRWRRSPVARACARRAGQDCATDAVLRSYERSHQRAVPGRCTRPPARSPGCNGDDRLPRARCAVRARPRPACSPFRRLVMAGLTDDVAPATHAMPLRRSRVAGGLRPRPRQLVLFGLVHPGPVAGGQRRQAVRDARLCRIAALAAPNSQLTGTSAHTDGRRSWMVQRETGRCRHPARCSAAAPARCPASRVRGCAAVGRLNGTDRPAPGPPPTSGS